MSGLTQVERAPVLIVCGPRSADPRGPALRLRLLVAVGRGPWLAVWHGDARGADQLGWYLGSAMGLPVTSWPADWARWGRAAGKRRSAEMITAAPPGSVLLVVGSPHGPGTSFTISRARARGLRVIIVS